MVIIWLMMVHEMVNEWLMNGYYMVMIWLLIWLLYGYYMVDNGNIWGGSKNGIEIVESIGI